MKNIKRLTELSCESFLEELSSEAPTPGGGGAAALVGAMAAALSGMVANLTVRNTKFVEAHTEAAELLEETESLRRELTNLVDGDAQVFQDFMSCYRLPKDTEAAKQERLLAIRRAAKKAALVPMEIARKSVSVLAFADRITVVGNPNVVTDAACSALLARAAMRSAFYSVYINLKLTGDEAFNAELLQEIKSLEEQALSLEQNTLSQTDRVLG